MSAMDRQPLYARGLALAITFAATACARHALTAAPRDASTRSVRCNDGTLATGCVGTDELCCAERHHDYGGVEMTFTADDGADPPPVSSTVALGSSQQPASTPPTGPQLPEFPDRSEVIRTMRALAPQIARCAPPADLIHVRVTIVFESSGRATRGAVSAPIAGAPSESCVLRALSLATLPPFQRPTAAIGFPVIVDRDVQRP